MDTGLNLAHHPITLFSWWPAFWPLGPRCANRPLISSRSGGRSALWPSSLVSRRQGFILKGNAARREPTTAGGDDRKSLDRAMSSLLRRGTLLKVPIEHGKECDMATTPTVILVHGAFADASGYAGVIRVLQ